MNAAMVELKSRVLATLAKLSNRDIVSELLSARPLAEPVARSGRRRSASPTVRQRRPRHRHALPLLSNVPPPAPRHRRRHHLGAKDGGQHRSAPPIPGPAPPAAAAADGSNLQHMLLHTTHDGTSASSRGATPVPGSLQSLALPLRPPLQPTDRICSTCSHEAVAFIHTGYKDPSTAGPPQTATRQRDWSCRRWRHRAQGGRPAVYGTKAVDGAWGSIRG